MRLVRSMIAIFCLLTAKNVTADVSVLEKKCPDSFEANLETTQTDKIIVLTFSRDDKKYNPKCDIPPVYELKNLNLSTDGIWNRTFNSIDLLYKEGKYHFPLFLYSSDMSAINGLIAKVRAPKVANVTERNGKYFMTILVPYRINLSDRSITLEAE